MSDPLPDVVRRYFELDPHRDVELFVALFSDDTQALSADRYLVTGRLTGDFPGGTADLKWDFTVTGERISRLVVAP